MLLLPLVNFIALLLIFFTKLRVFRPACLSAAIGWGVVLFSITEILSSFNGFNARGIGVAWLCADLLAAAWLWHLSGHFSKDWQRQLATWWQERRGSRDVSYTLIGCCGFIAVTTGLIALLCPPNTPDALFYHMPRVIHWLDHQNVEYYPTVYPPQLFMPPWAEYAMAHIFALGRGDRFVNLVQWFSLIGCGIGTSWIAALLGAPVRGQILAATVSITIPQGILQSSGAKNDYVEAFWLICCISFMIALEKVPVKGSAVMIGLSGGLALLTKGLAYVFIPPLLFSLWLARPRCAQVRFLKFLPLIAALWVMLNIQHYVRNYRLCGGLVGCSSAEADRNGIFKFANSRFTAPVTISNIIRNVALHIGTSSEEINKRMTRWISVGIRKFGGDPSDPGSTWPGENFRVLMRMHHEDAAGNTVHLLLIVAVVGVLLFDRRSRSVEILAYAGGLTLAFFLFCAYLRWQPWHTRLHLPLFVLWSAVVGAVFGRKLSPVAITGGGIVLFGLSMPALFMNQLRPILPKDGGIIVKNREDLYFAPTSYQAVGTLANQVSCTKVGIDARMVFNEYALLKSLRAGLGERIFRAIGVTNNSSKYATDLPAFEPQCVICIECPQISERWKMYEAAGMRALPAQNLTFFYHPARASSVKGYRMVVRFPPAQQPKAMPEPILTLGRFGAADFFYVRYLGDNRVSFGFHHFWVGGPDSPPLAIDPDVDHVVEILIDNSLSWIEIRLNGKSVLSHLSPVYPHSETEIYVGRNPVGGAAAGPAFSGSATAKP